MTAATPRFQGLGAVVTGDPGDYDTAEGTGTVVAVRLSRDTGQDVQLVSPPSGSFCAVRSSYRYENGWTPCAQV